MSALLYCRHPFCERSVELGSPLIRDGVYECGGHGLAVGDWMTVHCTRWIVVDDVTRSIIPRLHATPAQAEREARIWGDARVICVEVRQVVQLVDLGPEA